MATISQIDANRENAKKSTGPRSAEGKAASSQNALKSGIDAQSLIIRGESLTDLESLTATYQTRFQPATPEQQFLVDALIHADWQLRRLRKIEPQLWEKDFQRCDKYNEYRKDFSLADGIVRIDQLLNRLQRRLDSTERSYHRALKSLRQLRPDCFAPPVDPPPPVTPLSSIEIGFVPQAPDPPVSGPAPAAFDSQSDVELDLSSNEPRTSGPDSV